MKRYAGISKAVLLAAVLVHLCAADSASSQEESTPPLDSTTQPYDPSTETSVVAIASPTSEDIIGSPTSEDIIGSPTSEDTVGYPTSEDTVGSPTSEDIIGSPTSEDTVGSPTSEDTTISSTSEDTNSTGVRRVRQIPSGDAMTRMRPPPPPRVSPYPFWGQTPSPQSRVVVHARGPQTFPVRPPPTRVQTFAGFNPSQFTTNPFPVFAVFNPGRQRAQDFQGQFGSINQQAPQTNAVQAVIGFPNGRLQSLQDLNNVVQVVQGPSNNNNNQQVTLNSLLPPRDPRQPIAPQARPHDLQPSASNQAQAHLNEVRDFSALLNTAPHLQAAFGGGDPTPSAAPKPEPRKKATLKEILAEDCPLASAMGYCPSPPRYPAHQVGVITRQCEQIMESLYAPLPAQDTVVSTTLRSAVLASSNASDMERGNRQIWSWARYGGRDESGTDAQHDTMCSSVRREMEPGYARDMTSGRWFVVVQANNRYSQRVTVDRCVAEGGPCSGLKGAHCTGLRTRFKQSECVQRYSYVSLITWDPDQPQQCPKMRLFKFPTACVCQLN